jgi:hypothetical protein
MPQTGLEPMSHTSMALTAQYLNVRQLNLGTIIIQNRIDCLNYGRFTVLCAQPKVAEHILFCPGNLVFMPTQKSIA